MAPAFGICFQGIGRKNFWINQIPLNLFAANILKMKWFNFLFILCVSLLGADCSKDPVSGDHRLNYKLLFIGNSLTYTNNLPELVENEALKKNISLSTNMIANGNYAIIDHWEDGLVQKEINHGNYDFVIIQQGPSSQAEGRRMLIEDGKNYADLCQANGSELCYFMVWPSQTYYHTFDGVIKNHTDAAMQNSAILIPVGAIWKKHFDETNNFDYYGYDGFHPSLKGSQIAAEVIVSTLFD